MQCKGEVVYLDWHWGAQSITTRQTWRQDHEIAVHITLTISKSWDFCAESIGQEKQQASMISYNAFCLWGSLRLETTSFGEKGSLNLTCSCSLISSVTWQANFSGFVQIFHICNMKIYCYFPPEHYVWAWTEEELWKAEVSRQSPSLWAWFPDDSMQISSKGLGDN